MSTYEEFTEKDFVMFIDANADEAYVSQGNLYIPECYNNEYQIVAHGVAKWGYEANEVASIVLQ